MIELTAQNLVSNAQITGLFGKQILLYLLGQSPHYSASMG